MSESNEIIIWPRRFGKTTMMNKIKRCDELEEENKQLKIKLNNAYNEVAIWKANAKFMRNCMNCTRDRDGIECGQCEKLSNWSCQR